MAKKVRVSAKQAQEKHARRLGAALEDMRAGVERVDEAPGKRAAAKQGKLRANIIAAIDDGTWARRTASVSLEDWKSAMIDKGINRVTSGVEAASGKVESFFDELFAYENTVMGKIDAMADLTLEDSVNRSSTWIREMSKFRRK